MSTVPRHPAEGDINHQLLGVNGDVLNDVSPNERTLRLQALLAQWLRMENVVVLLGSGVSVAHGGPTMVQLEEDVLSALENLISAGALLGCEKLISARQADILLEESIGFEAWLSYLANAQYLLSAPQSPVESLVLRVGRDQTLSLGASELTQLLDCIGELVFVRCSLQLPKLTDKEGATRHHAFLAKLIARDPTLGRAHLFTTNYDTLIEQALDAFAIRYSDGFVGTVGRHFDPSGYGLDLYYPGDVAEGRVRRFDKFVHLYKTHGSITWRRMADGTITQSLKDASLDWSTWKAQTPAKQAQLLQDEAKRRLGRIGILPTENKFVQTLGMPYAHLFRALYQRLQEPQTLLIVCGYGFGDEHINALIDAGMTNPNLVLLVVTPVSNDAIDRRMKVYQSSGDRAFLLTGNNPEGGPPRYATFDDFAQNILPNVKWIDDFIRLRQTERGIQQLQQGNGDDVRQ